MIKQVNKNNKTSNMNILHIVQEITVKHVHDEKYGKHKKGLHQTSRDVNSNV